MARDKAASIAPPHSRKVRALATRRRMMEAAYHVFSKRGYAKTTMAEVAVEADVAVQTLYFTFHTKAELLQAAYEYAVLGPEALPPQLQGWWRTAEEAPDITTAIGLIVKGSIEVFERAAPLVWAVQGDEDARSTYRFNETLRAEGNAQLLAFLARKHSLRAGLTRRKARDLMLTLLGPHIFFLLTAELDWSTADFATWVRRALLRELFGLEARSLDREEKVVSDATRSRINADGDPRVSIPRRAGAPRRPASPPKRSRTASRKADTP